MYKFAFILLVALVTLLGLSTAVQAGTAEADASMKRETNAARFAQGMPPLAPAKRMEGMSSILYFLIELAYSLQTTLTVVKRKHHNPSPSKAAPGSAQTDSNN